MNLVVPILLLGLGLAFVVAEILFPSLGVLTFLAAASIIASIAMAFGISTGVGVNFLIAVALLVPTMILLGLKLFPRSPIGKKMVVGGLSHASARATDARDLELVGASGDVLSTLRPAGLARINGRRVDVVSRGEPIEPGTPVVVVEVRGNRVVVARADSRPAAAEEPGTPGPSGA